MIRYVNLLVYVIELNNGNIALQCDNSCIFDWVDSAFSG